MHISVIVKCILRFSYKFRMEIIFYLPLNTVQPKFVAFFFLYDCFIYGTNFVFRKSLDAILVPVAKQ